MYSKRIQEKVKKDYEIIADSFAETRAKVWKDFDLFLPYYNKSSTVLDIGCGNGRLLLFLKRTGFKSYLGVDQSARLIEIAKKTYGEKYFFVGDITNLPSISKRFDALFVIASFHHVPPSLQLQSLKKWKKHLNPNGFLFMTNWNLHQPRFWPLWIRSLIFPIYGFRGLLVPWQNILKRYYFSFSKARLTWLLKKAGFKLIYNEYVRDGQKKWVFTGENILTIAQNEDS